MKIFLYKKKNLIENREKTYKQTCSTTENRQRFICERVSQNRYQLPGEKNWTHEIEAKCARPVQDGVQTVKSPNQIAWHIERLLLHVRYTNRKRSQSFVETQ